MVDLRWTSLCRLLRPALDTLNRYKVAWTILTPKSAMVALLDRTPGWRRLYADEWAVVQVRDGPGHVHRVRVEEREDLGMVFAKCRQIAVDFRRRDDAVDARVRLAAHDEAIRLARSSGKPNTQIAQELGVTAETLRK